MTFSVCIVIPCYNHGAVIGETVACLAPYGLPIIIVDDGSDSATAAALAILAKANSLVRVFRRTQNGGKGAAVMCGMRVAHAAGFTHALQIDADGQHDVSDIPRFLAAGRIRPEATITGNPIYDGNVPKGRLYGRYLTHFWVWIETLSFSIGDSMCGFRLYPLKHVVGLIDRVKMSTHMNFDIEILVQLSWAGVPIMNVPTRVTYPEGGVSHFDMLWDNLRITATHARLVLGMALRLPSLLGRRFFSDHHMSRAGQTTVHWHALAERGSVWGLKLVAAAYRLFGRRAAMAMLLPPIAYFLLTGSQARQASRTYLRRLLDFAGPGAVLPKPTAVTVFRHMLAFAESGLDKLIAWRGEFDCKLLDFPDEPEFQRLMYSGRGALFISAHLGNLEMSRALAAQRESAKVNAVVYSEHARRFTASLEGASDRFSVNLLEVNNLGPDTALALKEKIDRGEILVIVGDRTPPADNGRVVRADFLGHPALFAQGPFVLAHLLECPVYLFFCLKERDRYCVHLEPFAAQIRLPRRYRETAIAQYAQRYAERLEDYCLRAPLQWFNFFDFWRSADQPQADSASSKSAGLAVEIAQDCKELPP